MKIVKIVFLGLFLCQSAWTAAPGSGRFGLGIAVGTPTAITGKYWVNDKHAIDFGVGFGGASWTMLYADYLFHFPGLFGSANKFTQGLSGYIGIGGGVVTWNARAGCWRWYCEPARDGGSAAFVRGPFGAEWFPGDPPLGVFAELAPFISFGNGVSSSLDLMIGVRYYF